MWTFDDEALSRIRNADIWEEEDDEGLPPEKSDEDIWIDELPTKKYNSVPAKVFFDDRYDAKAIMNYGRQSELARFRNPAPTEVVLSREYYHATSDTQSGEEILESGVINPSNPKSKALLAPRVGMTYMSPSLYIASIYALGGVFMGHRFDRHDTPFGKGRYGYIFLVDNSSLQDVEPDEDEVGEMATADMRSRGPQWLKSMASGIAAPSRLRRAMFGEVAYQASIGKQVLRQMPNYLKLELIEISGVSIANRGPVSISAAWRLDKNLSFEIEKDGSNVLVISERVL